MGFLLGNWQYIAIALLSAACTLFFNLWQGEVKDFAKYQGETEALSKAMADHAKRVNDRSKATLKEVRDEWAKKEPKIASLAIDNYMRRFPYGLCGRIGSGAVPGNASSPETPNGTKPERVAPAGKVTTPTTGDPQTDAFIAECGKDAGKLISFRAWVNGNQLPVSK